MFKEAKGTVCKMARDGLTYYDHTRPTAAMTDWRREGLGFVILQQHYTCVMNEAPFCCRNGWKLALCGSRKPLMDNIVTYTYSGNYSRLVVLESLRS